MVPLAALTRFEPRPGPEFTMRYNEYRAAQINGAAAPGYSADQATAALEEVFAQTMPREMGFDYMGMSFQEKKAQQGVPAWVVFAFSLLFVFLILAALYESWSLPFSVLLSTPVAVFGAFFMLWLRRTILQATVPAYMVQIEGDVYSQIGLVMLIGLAAKNAILIVEFAKDEYENGKPLVDAALEGARLRLRPILMTSFAFILGTVPLCTATGAGSVARQIMGTTVIGGMLAASLLGVFFIPVVFYVVEKWSGAVRADAACAVVGRIRRRRREIEMRKRGLVSDPDGLCGGGGVCALARDAPSGRITRSRWRACRRRFAGSPTKRLRRTTQRRRAIRNGGTFTRIKSCRS